MIDALDSESAVARPRLRHIAKRLRTPHATMLGAFAATSLLNYAFGLATGWLLLPGDFGLLAFAQTLLLIAGLTLNSGVPWLLARELLAVAAGRRVALARGALVANGGLAALLVAVVCALYGLGPLRPGLERPAILALLIAALPPMAILAVARGYANGLEDFAAVGLLTVAEIGVKVVAGIGLTLLGFGVAGAVAGFAAGALLGALLGARYLAGHIPFGRRGALAFPPLRDTVPLFVAILGLALILNLDLVALKLATGDDRSPTGLYQAGIVLANLPYYLVTAALAPILFAQVARRGSLTQAAGGVGEMLGNVALLIMPLEFALIVAPDTALGLFFPANYAPGATTLRVLALGNSFVTVAALLSTAFQAGGRADIPARTLAAIALLEMPILAKVVPRWQAAGAATTFVAAALVALLALASAYLRMIGWARAGRIGWWLLRYGAACAAGACGAGFALMCGWAGWQALLVAAPLYLVGGLATRLVALPGRPPRG